MFRSLLRDQLARRRARNRRYSLRAFARDLGLHHGTLSQLINGRRPATTRQIRALAQPLQIDATTIDACCDAATDASVLDTIRRPDRACDSRWLATRSGLPVDEVNASLFRLLRDGALRMTDRTEWRTDA